MRTVLSRRRTEALRPSIWLPHACIPLCQQPSLLPPHHRCHSILDLAWDNPATSCTRSRDGLDKGCRGAGEDDNVSFLDDTKTFSDDKLPFDWSLPNCVCSVL
jgi:hypothetical protein